MTYSSPLTAVDSKSKVDPKPTPQSPQTGKDVQLKSLHWIIRCGIALVWIYLSVPELNWLAHLIHTLSRFNIVLLICAAAVLIFQGVRSRKSWKFSMEATLPRSPLLMMSGMAIASVASRWWLDLEQLSIIWFVIGTYGVIGLFSPSQPWRRGIPFMGAFAAFVLLMAAEFTDVGHLVRTAIAEVVEWFLIPFGVPSLSSEDILVLDTGIALVDIPCSGFKNIEIGSLFFIVASLLQRKRMGLKWSLIGLLNLTLLILANIARIFVIVIFAYVMEQQILAEMLHVPLGLFGFITVCLITLQLLRWIPSTAAPPAQAPSNKRETPPLSSSRKQFNGRSIRYGALSLGLMLGLTLIPHPPVTSALPIDFTKVQWDAALHTEAIALNPYEETFFNRYPGVVAQKQTFHVNDLSGSMILVSSPTWQAHHAPELCFSANGLTIDHMEQQSLTRQITGRWLSLNHGQQQAAYWFQSPQRTTDHYLDRVWSEITRQEPQWTMVSILFDSPSSKHPSSSLTTDDTDVQTLLEGVHGAIATTMTEAQV